MLTQHTAARGLGPVQLFQYAGPGPVQNLSQSWLRPAAARFRTSRPSARAGGGGGGVHTVTKRPPGPTHYLQFQLAVTGASLSRIC